MSWWGTWCIAPSELVKAKIRQSDWPESLASIELAAKEVQGSLWCCAHHYRYEDKMRRWCISGCHLGDDRYEQSHWFYRHLYSPADREAVAISPQDGECIGANLRDLSLYPTIGM